MHKSWGFVRTVFTIAAVSWAVIAFMAPVMSLVAVSALVGYGILHRAWWRSVGLPQAVV